MNKKQSGLLTAMPQQGGLINAMPESEVDRNKREARDAFITNWKKENSDIVRDMEKWPKLQLVELLIKRMVGNAYDKALSEYPSESDAQVEINAYVALHPILLKGTPEEQLSALAKWETEMILNAGGSTIKVAQIAHIAGATEVRIKERHKIKAFKVRKENIKKVQPMGAAATAEKSEQRKEKMKTEVLEYLKKPINSGKLDGAVADHLMLRGFHKFGENELSKKQVMRYVKKIRAEYMASQN